MGFNFILCSEFDLKGQTCAVDCVMSLGQQPTVTFWNLLGWIISLVILKTDESCGLSLLALCTVKKRADENCYQAFVLCSIFTHLSFCSFFSFLNYLLGYWYWSLLVYFFYLLICSVDVYTLHAPRRGKDEQTYPLKSFYFESAKYQRVSSCGWSRATALRQHQLNLDSNKRTSFIVVIFYSDVRMSGISERQRCWRVSFSAWFLNESFGDFNWHTQCLLLKCSVSFCPCLKCAIMISLCETLSLSSSLHFHTHTSLFDYRDFVRGKRKNVGTVLFIYECAKLKPYCVTFHSVTRK